MNLLIKWRDKVQAFCFYWKESHKRGRCKEMNGHYCVFCELSDGFDADLAAESSLPPQASREAADTGKRVLYNEADGKVETPEPTQRGVANAAPQCDLCAQGFPIMTNLRGAHREKKGVHFVGWCKVRKSVFDAGREEPAIAAIDYDGLARKLNAVYQQAYAANMEYTVMVRHESGLSAMAEVLRATAPKKSVEQAATAPPDQCGDWIEQPRFLYCTLPKGHTHVHHYEPRAAAVKGREGT